ncbi:MAG TPA: hypothetical protein VG028_22325 [Terriglobia bacterium]|nr:hypothetical protein [Terriglobia bacterium]
MTKKSIMLLVLALSLSSWALAAPAKSWIGTVSDEHCGVKHAAAGDAAAECVKKCAAGGAKYVLVSHGKVYNVDAQDKFADFAGQSVKVTGSMKGTDITVASVAAAPAKKSKMKKMKM